jgi:hypothetical protein
MVSTPPLAHKLSLLFRTLQERERDSNGLEIEGINVEEAFVVIGVDLAGHFETRNFGADRVN